LCDRGLGGDFAQFVKRRGYNDHTTDEDKNEMCCAWGVWLERE
jgi:hypothetical protein